DFAILEQEPQTRLRVFPRSTRSLMWSRIPVFNRFSSMDFIYMLNTLEKLQNPQLFLERIRALIPQGYIQTSSPIVECLYREKSCRGNILNRWIIWVDPETNCLHLLPKYGVFEHITLAQDFEKSMNELIATYPHYSFTYYAWSPEKPLQYIVYEQGLNFDVRKDYPELLKQAIEESVQSTNYFLNHINTNKSIFKDNDPIPSAPEA
ncbi:hypothetical protein EBU71_22245, partial [bacterium]|nr:hypothetical protein [Candidatus Elulimicrobium humile]